MPSERCPTCGQLWLPRGGAAVYTADQLVAAMKIPPPLTAHRKGQPEFCRDVYEGAGRHDSRLGSGEYFLTYGGGRVDRSAIDEALRHGLIAPSWPDVPDSWSLPEKAAENHRRWHERYGDPLPEREVSDPNMTAPPIETP